MKDAASGPNRKKINKMVCRVEFLLRLLSSTGFDVGQPAENVRARVDSLIDRREMFITANTICSVRYVKRI